MLMKNTLLFGVAAAAICTVPSAFAQEHDEKHIDEDIVVTGALIRNRVDVLSGVAIVSGEELAQHLRPSLGETLDHTPGVSATSFGPSASRPVLRGLQGERVRVLTDGIGTIDVSNTSVDHATAVNPLLAERIEVLRGPQSLLYGASAIGGVVNVISRRIPTSVPDEPIHIGAVASYGSAADERTLAGTAAMPLGENFVVHVDGSWSKSDDLRIGGFALTPALRAQAIASSLLPPEPDSDIDFLENAAVAGRLPNTAARSWDAAVSAAYINEGGNIAVAYSHIDNLYGIPLRFATQPGQEQEAPRIHVKQDRIDARAEIAPQGAVISKLGLRFGFADYRHAELEEDGAVGTEFFNKGLETRFEITQADRGGWSGVTGAQYVNRNFNVVGAEAFLPRFSVSQFGLFTMQQFELDALKVEAGARYDRSVMHAKPVSLAGAFVPALRTFDTVSGSLGASWRFAEEWRFGVNLSRTSRAPAAEELFANGPHAGTNAYEIGDLDLKPERTWSVEALLRGKGDGYSLEASAYHSWFSNFIFDGRTGGFEDGLPVYQIGQADARFYGFEVEGTLRLATFGDWKLEADALVDYVHAEIESYGPAPRIPPLRVLGGLSLTSEKWDLRAEVERVTGQDRVAPNETPTPGFTMTNLELAWRPWGGHQPLSFMLSASNLFNVNARRHASFLKDYAPLAGRDIRISVRLEI
ncbi:TonB-dependent receptor [Novosphingobium sp. TH158]|uniref:TonB-dependent receptor n=1 Tax=Novosphingobium sp. TH158 TaxID=2067455 RepID=UPI000C796143|nr:TonB-dependent receptor [Novosphingobium sp. TH158]PLK27469.1 TonB-dependent receptor [Novosphingobium sp. TH158]